MVNAKDLQGIANILRRDVIDSTTQAGSGHPTTCMSAAEIMSVLFFSEMSYDHKNAFHPDNDEFILSKGHAAPILYSALYRAGCIQHNPITLREIKSPLEGHPMPSRHLTWVKTATGSLGQGLSSGAGIAMAAKLQKRKFRTYVLIGDSGSSEGSIYEAAILSAHYKLDNLCAVLDVNRLGQRGETMLGHNIKEYQKRWEALGWKTITVDGHNVKSLLGAFKQARKTKGKPTIILAKTLKGKGYKKVENINGWHGKALSPKMAAEALEKIPNPKVKIKFKTLPKKPIIKPSFKKAKTTNYKIGDKVATRDAYGTALANLAKVDNNLIAIDAEVSNSTKSDKVKEVRPKQFIEAFIAEQNMVSMALGLAKKDLNVFGSTFACFLSRAHDQLRMAALSKPSTLTYCGSHVGVSIGGDGPSQMGLEDLAIFRSLPYCYVFYPSDAVSTENLVQLAYKTLGMKYIRTTRPKTPVIYKNSEKFPLGDFKVLKSSGKDSLVIAGAGITVHEALKAQEQLKDQGINAAVVDTYCIAPFNAKKFAKFVKAHGGKLVVSEDHYPEGGLGEMLCSALSDTGIKITTLAVNNIPHSGKDYQLLEKFGISANNIIKAAKAL